MADELTVAASLAFSKSSRNVSITIGGTTFDVAGDKYSKIIQAIGTSEEALALGDVGTPGWVLVKNLDATNYVSLRPATGVADMIKMKPGEFALFRLAGAAPFAIADTTSCDIEIVIIDD